ncbi:MAG: PKD domain-containing protein, partial [Bacteroidetes bacterium]|nr:PKD domain-containing protein [Bacteroidota bacterium]
MALNSPKQVYYEENKNQWPSQVMFKANVSGGAVFLEKDRFTFNNYHTADLDKISSAKEITAVDSGQLIRCHAWSVHFGNSLPAVVAEGRSRQNAYSNYFIGNDEKKWAGLVKRFESVYYSELYSGIDLHAKSEGSWFKYDFIVSAGADVSQINLNYEGITPRLQSDGTLLLALSSGDVTEQRPVAWQVLNGIEIPVRCAYQLNGNVLSFAFPDGYNKQLPLIIDPVVVGATYSGSLIPLFSYSGTYDDQGNIYASGSCTNIGYPTTVGAYSTTFSGPNDIVITKYDTTASTQIYSTYIGGISAEAVFSMIVSPAGELYIMGYSASPNYPVTPAAYDAVIGGPNDIIITRFNATGSALLGSTFIGGSNQDGFDFLVGSFTARSEIIIGANGNVYVASNSRSADFPVTPGAAQTTFGGLQDAVVFSMPPTLSSLIFSTYLGGSLTDGSRSLRVNPANGHIYVCGATSSSNFPVTPGAYQTALGGAIDAYVTRLNANATAIVASTYYGIPVCTEHFVHTELTAAGEVYLAGMALLGLSSGPPITAGVYSNPNSSVMITKMDATLSNVIFATRIGNSTPNTVQLIMTAFTVDDCENIYVAGVNGFNYPTTPNALYPNNTALNGGLYVAQLAPNATSLIYATHLTGAHTYGGMSRFSRSGVLYQTVAALNFPFQATPGAYATSPNITDDMCAVKFDLQVPPPAQARAETLLGDTGCAPFTVSFNNTSTGTNFIWDFGDGSPVITTFSPFHIYTTPGIYTVTLIATSSLGCVTGDTLTLNITVLPEPVVNLGADTVLCASLGNLILDAGNPGFTYNWSTAATTQTIAPATPGTYWVQVNNGICTNTDTILISLTPAPPPLSDSTLCSGQ